MSGGLCVVCDRPICRHGAALYAPSSPAFSPTVETETGEAMRQRALGFLTESYRELAERSKTFAFSPIEGTLLESTGRALDSLTGMAPALGLILTPRDSKAWFQASI